MRIAITGATGNVGTALVRALVADDRVDEIVGLARRLPDWRPPKTTWVQADVARDRLLPHFAGADAVVHLAWLIQPSRNRAITDAVNVEGSRRVFEAAHEAGVDALVYASSVAAYSPGGPDRVVDETWPTGGIPGSYYSQQKAEVERILDDVELRHPHMRVARARPGLIFQREAAAAIRRYFFGPFVPGWAARRALIPVVPQMRGLVGQVLHSDDVADLYRRLILDDTASGAYNAAANPPLDGPTIGRLLGARPVPIPAALARAAVAASWHARLHPVSPDWLDVGLGAPVMYTTRAREELGWLPQHQPGDVILEFMAGLRANAGFPTPPLEADAGGPFRIRELLSGVGGPNRLDRQSGTTAPRM